MSSTKASDQPMPVISSSPDVVVSPPMLADQSSRPRWSSVRRNSPAFLLSTLGHMLLILLLTLMAVALPEKVKEISLTVGPVEDEPLSDESVAEFDPLPLVATVSGGGSAGQVDPESVVVPTTQIALDELLNQQSDEGWQQISVGIDGLLQNVAKSSGEGKGEGDGSGNGSGLTANFAGTESNGQRFVFMVDNSGSMIEGKLETALREVDKAVSGLKPNQSFYVLFYSDKTYGMFYPATAKSMVLATESNKQELRDWLSTVELCSYTRGSRAIEQAIALHPDVIYLLGDGAFSDNTVQQITGNPEKEIIIHTIGIQIDERGQRLFSKIAEVHNGEFRNIDVPFLTRLFRGQGGKRPMRRKGRPGPVWGNDL